MKASEIRNKFTEYFLKKDHQKIESSPLVPQNDPTLLFANAGMNQFKDYFTGKATPKNKKATTIQKVVRAGGKHNDLENVGFTARHHTFFEMLGNFSFGDYFKKEAIQMAWEFLTVELKLPPEKLYITVHENDDEALNIWHKEIGLPKEKIFKKGDKDNFWEMGDVGPCGPCSEIFYDHGEQYTDPSIDLSKAKDILEDEMRYVEIWNLVFMQFEKSKDGVKDLPNPSIDTGAGLERLAAAMQGVYWNYDTDCFTPIIKKLEELSGKKYTDENYQGSMRVIADHARSCTMLITDGVIPSNEGRGYVLRRIIRRAIRHLKDLGLKEVCFHKLVPCVFEILGEEYSENKASASLAVKLLQVEEKKFLETLDQGLKFLNEALSKNLKDKTLPGEIAFKLYDTYGFPLDLTEVILKEQDLLLDQAGFDKAMKKQKENSKKSWKGGTGGVDLEVFHKIFEKHGETQFHGYSTLTHSTKLLHKENLGDIVGLIFSETPFYGESGGQMGDKGSISDSGNVLCHISDVQKPVDGLFVHFSNNADALEVGKEYQLNVDPESRDLTKRNHSATHLLQSALIEVLGDHVKQAGSNVGPSRLRFDFTHPEAVSKEELIKVENLVNQKIQEALNVSPQIMTKDEALKEGAMALFGEKYGNEVRVLKMGDFSTELCGGTHVDNTREIEIFSILSESSLSSGVRRIEAITSNEAMTRLLERSTLMSQVENQLSLKAKKIPERISQLMQTLKEKEKELKELKEKIQAANSKDLFSNPEELGNGLLFKATEAPEGSDLRKLSDLYIDKHNNGLLVLFNKNKGKTSLLVRTHKSNKNINCNLLLKEGLALINGRGGGKPDMAQGSGDLTSDMSQIIQKIRGLADA